MAETGFGSRTNQKLSGSPSSTVLDVHPKPFRPSQPEKLIHLVIAARLTRANSSNLSTQLRRAQTRNNASPGFCPRSGPPSNPRFGANTSGSDCTIHRIRKDMKPSTKPISINGERFHTWQVTHVVDVVVVVVFHIQRIGCQPEKLLYTVTNPVRGLLNRGKRAKEKVWQRTPPFPLPTLLVRRKIFVYIINK